MMVSCICGHVGVWVEWSSIGRMEESFVFSLTDADILSCLLSLHFAALYPSYWHAPSLHYIVMHWCVHSPSLCIAPLLCLWFSSLLCVSLDTPPHCPPRLRRRYRPVILPPPSLTLFHLPISSFLPPLCLHPAGLSLSFTLPSSLIFLPSHPSYLLFQSALPPPLPPTTCLCSTPVSRHLRRMLGEVGDGSSYGGIEWMMMALLVLQGCCVLWPGKAQMPFFLYKVLRRWMRRFAGWVCVFLCMCVMHRSQAGRETTGPGCTPKA